MALELMSTAFDNEDEIPSLYTCEGEDLSPPLSWAWVPAGTETLALVAEDPDAADPGAPARTWVHWVLYNIPPDVEELEAGADPDDLPGGIVRGVNDRGDIGYDGPCPPAGRHRYVFTLYALDARLPDVEGLAAADLRDAMKRHVLESAELIGLYEKKGGRKGDGRGAGRQRRSAGRSTA
jgi:hypothetical protein